MMYRIIMRNQLYFIGKVSELLEMLQDISMDHITLQSFINSHLKD